MKLSITITLLMAITLFSDLTQAQWTRRKGKKGSVRPEMETADEPDPSSFGNFDSLNKLANMNSGQGNVDMMQQMRDLLDNVDPDEYAKAMSQGMEAWQELMNSPEVQQVMNDPDQMREAVKGFLELTGSADEATMAQVDQLLQDPETLKQSMESGFEMVKDMFSDPEKIKGMMDELYEGLDENDKDRLQRLANGDQSVMNEVLGDMDLEQSMSKLIAGMSAEETAELEKYLGNPSFEDAEFADQMQTALKRKRQRSEL